MELNPRNCIDKNLSTWSVSLILFPLAFLNNYCVLWCHTRSCWTMSWLWKVSVTWLSWSFITLNIQTQHAKLEMKSRSWIILSFLQNEYRWTFMSSPIFNQFITSLWDTPWHSYADLRQLASLLDNLTCSQFSFMRVITWLDMSRSQRTK